jgi:hypothetical protein
MSAPVQDQEYYQAARPDSLAERVLVKARDRIFRDFMAQMQPSSSDKILDVGVSDVINDGANVLERSYEHQRNITACGLGAGVAFQRAFPLVRYVRIEPNVVLEHVGSLDHQFQFVRELCRVAKRVFISVPNRFFPVEHHTAIPLAHFHDGAFRFACRLTGKSEWAREENLILMTRARLRQLAAPLGRNAAVGTTGLRLGPFSSNLYLAVR